jgi:GNAT superfamily N-acetyltransferase
MDILNVADPMGREEVALAEAFNDCPELCSKTAEWMDKQGFSGYIQGVFVEPEYRRRGIASYLLTHLDQILAHTLHIAIRAVGVSPMPFADLDGEIVEDADALARNRQMLEKCGYHEILDQSLQGMMYGNYDEEETSGTGYFVRVYSA